MKLFIMVILLLLTSCTKIKTSDPIKILMPNGAPSLAQIKIENEIKHVADYEINISRVGDPTLLAAGFSGDEYDVIYAPINMGVKQYNKTNKFKVLGSITNGNIYFVSKTELKDISDLNDRPLHLFGKDTINASVINHLLSIYNIKPSNINYLGGTKDTLTQFVSSKDNGVYVIAEPVLSATLNAKKIKHYTLDINSLLKDNNIDFIQAAVFYRNDLDAKFVDKYYELLTESIHFVNNSDKVLDLITTTDIGLPKNINMNIIKKCNIKFNRLNKDILDKFIELDITKFGGKPNEAFYY